jgi:alkyl hydroperoxide reductase subunit AhpF
MLLAKLENENPRFVLRRQGLAAEGAPLTLRTPEGKFHGPRIRVESPWGAGFDYLGYPADAELAAFLDSVLITSGLGPGLAPSTARTIASLPGEARIEVFVTPLCPMCADAFRLAAALAAHSPRIRLTVVNLAEFPELGKAYGVSVVPHIWINSRVSVVGAPPESYLASRIADAFHR